jgi:hypothetical protein
MRDIKHFDETVPIEQLNVFIYVKIRRLHV